MTIGEDSGADPADRPGTGATALLEELLRQADESTKVTLRIFYGGIYSRSADGRVRWEFDFDHYDWETPMSKGVRNRRRRRRPHREASHSSGRAV